MRQLLSAMALVFSCLLAGPTWADVVAGPTVNINTASAAEMAEVLQGIGEAKAVSIAAALEVGRRRRGEDAPKIEKIGSSKDAYHILHPMLGELEHEEFWILFLNNSNKVLHKAQLSKGGITGTLVDVRIVMKQALELGAVAIILAHNHPSGTLRPSAADKQITQKIKTASETLDIKVLDHLIITQKSYYSFADENML